MWFEAARAEEMLADYAELKGPRGQANKIHWWLDGQEVDRAS